ncbi:MAG: hypothetical protein DHS20C11_35420 [Lysobacteraceae bacterium]|nr:MAG: hypothetical protein DHS20C11_35420 [Xanthomonadaceae bacterium]
MSANNTAALAATLLAVSMHTLAQDTPPSDYTEMSLRDLLDLEVFTSASLLPTKTTEAPATVYSFDSDDFRRYGVRRVEDLLQYVPGIQLNQYRKRHQSIWSRGLLDRYNDKLILIVDGIRQQHLYYGHFGLGDNLPIERIAKVEIILSPASSLYGANAFGGIISITSHDFSDGADSNVTLELADNARLKATGFYNSERFQVFASALDQDAPFRKDRRSFIGSNVLQPLDENYQSLLVRGKPAPELTLALDYNASETPFLFIPPTQDAFIDSSALTLSATFEKGDVEEGRFEANVYYTDDRATEYELEQVTQRLGYWENQDATLAGGMFRWLKAFGAHTVALGATAEYEAVEDVSFVRYFLFSDGFLPEPVEGHLLSDPDIKNENFAVFAQDIWSINEQLDLTLNARLDTYSQFDSEFNYRAALVYTPNVSQTWKLMYGTATRAPTLREYLKVLESDFVPPALQPESIRSLELNFSHQWDEAALGINVYRNRLTDFILEQPTPDGGDEYFANLPGRFESTGIEMLLDVRPSEKTNLRLGLSNIDIDRSTSGIDVPYVAEWTGNLSGQYLINEQTTLGLSLFYNSDRPDTNNFPNSDPGSFLLTNMSLSGQFTPTLLYSAGINNVFDKRVFDPASDFGSQHNTEKSEREIWFQLQWFFDR